MSEKLLKVTVMHTDTDKLAHEDNLHLDPSGSVKICKYLPSSEEFASSNNNKRSALR